MEAQLYTPEYQQRMEALVELIGLTGRRRERNSEVQGFALAASKVVLGGGVGRMLELARSNVRNFPRP